MHTPPPLCPPSEDPRSVELASAFHVLQKFRSTITEDVDPNNESIDLDTEIDEDALAQLNGLIKWMDSKINSTTRVRL